MPSLRRLFVSDGFNTPSRGTRLSLSSDAKDKGSNGGRGGLCQDREGNGEFGEGYGGTGGAKIGSAA